MIEAAAEDVCRDLAKNYLGRVRDQGDQQRRERLASLR